MNGRRIIAWLASLVGVGVVVLVLAALFLPRATVTPSESAFEHLC
jgi:hypothetical protein